MLVNVRRLAEHSEAHASHRCGHPDANAQSGATVRSRAAATFDAGREQRDRDGRGLV